MLTTNEYELLKFQGSWQDRIKYILSQADKTHIEHYLKQSSSYDDLKALIFLSELTKNEEQLFQIFTTNSLPNIQRIIAIKSWLKLQTNEQHIYDFVVETINNKQVASNCKNQILKYLHRIDCLKKSPSFFYNLLCHLTITHRHDQFNLDSHLVPFCLKDQILDLLSRWSIHHLKQLNSSRLFQSKLIRHQPSIVLHLMRFDMFNNENSHETNVQFFQDNYHLLVLLAKREAKATLRLLIEYTNQLKQHQRILPYFIQCNLTYFLKKVPDEMIELITLLASHQPGTVKYQPYYWDKGTPLTSLPVPRSFSIDHYTRLFLALYDTCQWSVNHTIRAVQFLLEASKCHHSCHNILKRRKWLFDIVINGHVGREVFFSKLLEESDEHTLTLFEEYPEISTPLSIHLLSELEKHKTVTAQQRFFYIHYQSMTKDIFDQLIHLFAQTSSDVKQRERNYKLFLNCALATNNEQVNNVLQWIQKRFTNERINVIESFLTSLSLHDNRFQLEILPGISETINTIIEIALNHIEGSETTLQIIVDYGLVLLRCAEHCRNQEKRQILQDFACKMIKRCFSKKPSISISVSSLSRSYSTARNIMADIFVSNVFSMYLSKCMLDELSTTIQTYFPEAWSIPKINSFISSFFYEYLPSSTKLQSAFRIDSHSSMISLFLKNRSTQYERVHYLINNIDKIFFLNETVQRIALCSQQYQSFIDKLIDDNSCLTYEKLAKEQTPLAVHLQCTTKNIKLPGLFIQILNSSSRYLTGKQQQHIAKIILHDFIQDKDISNPMKLRSLYILRHLTHIFPESLRWLEETQTALDSLIICLPSRFDLSTEDLLKQFDYLKIKLNASNAKYISDAMLVISRKIPTDLFLERYLDFVSSERFSTLGITANKEILRLLNEHASDTNLIKSLIEPLWTRRPHQDIRACLILILMNFMDQLQGNEEKTMIWKILEEAADDNYLPVVQSLFSAQRGSSRWPLSRSENLADDIFRTFVNRIQFKVLNHPTLLDARLWAWTNIHVEYCDLPRLMEKSKQLCIEFDKNANNLWKAALIKVISYRQQKTSLSDYIISIIEQLMSSRMEIDSKQNALDKEHDLPVYHRLQGILRLLISYIDQFDNRTKLDFRSSLPSILQFEKTFAIIIGELLLKIAENRHDLESMLELLEKNLPTNYFENILKRLATIVSTASSCPFVERLSVLEKLDLVEYFANERNQGLFVFELFKDHVFNGAGTNREQSVTLLRRLRQSDNLYLKEQAMKYTVPWRQKKLKKQNRSNPRTAVDQDSSDIDLSDAFDFE